MRDAEIIVVVCSGLFAALAWARPLDLVRRLKVLLLALVILTAVLLASRVAVLNRPWIHAWLPAALLLVPYWQIGQFFTGPNPATQQRLAQIDAQLALAMKIPRTMKLPSWLREYFELAYLFCYPLIPFGVATLEAAHLGRYVDEYWAVVLPPTCICYVVTIFVPALPPRLLAGDPAASDVRALNLWLLRHASIQATTFPSAHVTSTVAASLALFRHLPVAGAIFLCIALSIAAGAVIGRYHYAVDVLAGMALAFGTVIVSPWIFSA